MNALDAAAAAVKSLAWPATVVVAMVLFRVPLTALIGRIRRVTVSEGSTVIDFRATLAAIEARLPPGGAAPAALRRHDAPPAEIIDAAWTRLEAALGQGHAAVPADLAGAIAMLRALRDQAVERGAPGLTTADAFRFEGAAVRLAGSIEAG